jgi:2',3'-cyclic-nucleotide 2'-phosphodiesterase/3'-nucleotidase
LRLKQIENGNLTLDQPYYNFSSAAGIEYLVDVSKPEGNKVHILGLSSGAPFYSDSTYTVALNSYRGSGGGGHLAKGAGLSAEELLTRKIASSEFDMRYYLRKWIEDKRVITPKKGTNWRIIPEEYFELGKQKDMELLFGK